MEHNILQSIQGEDNCQDTRTERCFQSGFVLITVTSRSVSPGCTSEASHQIHALAEYQDAYTHPTFIEALKETQG